MINTAPQFGFLVFLPTFFTTTVGLRLGQWLQLLSYMFLSNIIANLLSGIVGDKLGWRRTVAYVGGIGCTVTTLLLYYVPVAHRGNFGLAVVVSVLYGATLAGFVPLTANHAALGAGKQRCRHLDANPRGGCKRYAWSGDRRRLHWTARS